VGAAKIDECPGHGWDAEGSHDTNR